MGIGASLFLIAVGAIFAFALDLDTPGINFHIVGWILMAIGVAGMALSFFYWGPRRRGLVKERVYTDDPSQPPPPA